MSEIPIVIGSYYQIKKPEKSFPLVMRCNQASLPDNWIELVDPSRFLVHGFRKGWVGTLDEFYDQWTYKGDR